MSARAERWRTATIFAFGIALIASSIGLVVLGRKAVHGDHTAAANRIKIEALEAQVRSLGGTPGVPTIQIMPVTTSTTTTTSRSTAPGATQPPRGTNTPSTTEIGPPSPQQATTTTSSPPTSTTTTLPPPPPTLCVFAPPIIVGC